MKIIVSNGINKELVKLFPKNFHIAAKREFFKEVGIRQIRFGQIFRDEKPATMEELRQISRYFKIPIERFIKVKPEKSNSLIK